MSKLVTLQDRITSLHIAGLKITINVRFILSSIVETQLVKCYLNTIMDKCGPILIHDQSSYTVWIPF